MGLGVLAFNSLVVCLLLSACDARETVTPAAVFPTPHPGNSAWAVERLDAVIGLYGFTGEGAALFRSLDLRRMRGEPGFFGSYGFHGWAGVGEARPIPVMHELSHSYWGGFPVAGMPELGWEAPPGGGLPPALERYHADVLLFMAQPPDEFELLRQRWRNLPGLHSGNTEPLLHNAEADMVYNTGGDLALVPPALRKYWSRASKDGPFRSWPEAAAWFQSLSGADRALAGQFLGFEHLDLRDYAFPAPRSSRPRFLADKRGILETEEKRRLYDLAEQFDLLTGGPQENVNFSFWRGYLRDKVRLHRKFPGYMASLDLPGAGRLAGALDAVAGLEPLPPEAQAERLGALLAQDPFLVNFLPALDDRTLPALFAGGADLPEGAYLQATASFVQRLDRFEGIVDGVLSTGRADPVQGAAAMRRFLEEGSYGPKEDVRLFLGLMRGRDREAANRILLHAEQSVIRRLMEAAPAHVRAMLRPGQLLAKLDIATDADAAAMADGAAVLVRETSGNFVIDRPYLDAMHRVIAARAASQPGAMLTVLAGENFPLYGFVRRQPEAAAAILGRDPEAALQLVSGSDPVVSPPARVLHRLAQAGPEVAASLSVELDRRGEDGLVIAALGYMAYDSRLAETAPGLEISLEKDALFLEALLREKGEDWLTERLARVLVFHTSPESGLPADFASEFEATLMAAAELRPSLRDSVLASLR